MMTIEQNVAERAGAGEGDECKVRGVYRKYPRKLNDDLFALLNWVKSVCVFGVVLTKVIIDTVVRSTQFDKSSETFSSEHKISSLFLPSQGLSVDV